MTLEPIETLQLIAGAVTGWILVDIITVKLRVSIPLLYKLGVAFSCVVLTYSLTHQ